MAGLLDSDARGTMTTVDAPPRPRLQGDRETTRVVEPDTETLPDEIGENPNVTEAEQQLYEEFVLGGYKLIYEGGEVLPGILAMLDEDPADLIEALGAADDTGGEMRAQLQQASPSIRLAATAVIVVMQLVKDIDPDELDATIVFHGGRALYEDLGEVMERAKLHEFSQEELDKGWLYAMDLYREAAGEAGLLHNDEIASEWNDLVAADREGNLGDYLPELQRINEDQGDDPAERKRLREEEGFE